MTILRIYAAECETLIKLDDYNIISAEGRYYNTPTLHRLPLAMKINCDNT